MCVQDVMSEHQTPLDQMAVPITHADQQAHSGTHRARTQAQVRHVGGVRHRTGDMGHGRRFLFLVSRLSGGERGRSIADAEIGSIQ